LVISHFLSQGSSFVLPMRADGTDALNVVVGAGRGCVLEAEAPVAGVWIPLRGRLQFATGSGDLIATGELGTTEAEPGLRVIGRGNALWVALLGTKSAWQRALGSLSEIPIPDPVLLPARHIADAALRRRAIAVARAAADGRADAVVAGLLDAVFSLQDAFGAAIERCPGRTYVQRRQVFLRLQRVRNYVMANCHRELDNEELARIANYSPWQFIRAFRSAYEQTPHAFVIEQRLRRARRLLLSSSLSIAEIASASGFEDRCAFSRLFSERFGVTARAFRRETNATRLVA
jgi:AraC family transcriptional regulator